MSVGRFLQQAAAGNAGAGVYVDDVFSTYLYEGNGSTQTITNGIDLDGEGGMVWFKARSTTYSHHVFDTERGATKRISTDTTSSEATTSTSLTAFNNNGFSLGSFAGVNLSNQDYASWTFRKQPGFFDVVTYTGTGSAQNISHSLGTTPGMIIVKNRTDSATNWIVYHRRSNGGTNPEQYSLLLNSTNAQASVSGDWNNTAPTDTQFTVGNQNRTNGSGDSFVAYLFAHDAQDFGTGSDESIIKCGSYTGTGSAGNNVDVGFEPQWIMFKRTNSSSDWVIFDSMRGLTTSGNNGDRYLYPNQSTAEGGLEQIALTPTGFVTEGSWGEVNANGGNYIYVAIRRPHKPAEEFEATELFTPQTTLTTTTTGLARYQPGHLVDMVIAKATGAGFNGEMSSRLTQGKYLVPNSTTTEATDAWYAFDYNDGFGENGAGSAYTSNSVHYMFRRAPGFFDVVTYTGTGAIRTIEHNLNSVPQFMIVKKRSATGNWVCYHEGIGNGYGHFLHSNVAPSQSISYWNDTTPTETVFSLGTNGNVNGSGATFVAYLFATVNGISKVGTYTGTGSDVDVDCGFTSGARFVLIRRFKDGTISAGTGDWYLWDSERGIVAGNDPYLLLNSTAAQVTSTDYIDPLSSGFTVTSSAPAAINASADEYIFLAIA